MKQGLEHRHEKYEHEELLKMIYMYVHCKTGCGCNAHALNDSDVRDVLDDCDVFEVCEVRDVHDECDVCNVLAVIDSDVYYVQDVLDECDVRGFSVMPMIPEMTVILLMTVQCA